MLEDFCPKLDDPVGGIQRCADWGPGGRFQVCKIECNDGLKFSQEVRLLVMRCEFDAERISLFHLVLEKNCCGTDQCFSFLNITELVARFY